MAVIAVGLVMLCAALITGGPAALGAVTTGPPCRIVSHGLTPHFTLANDGQPGAVLEALVLTGFDIDTCHDQSVRVTLFGNAQGDPTQPATDLLSTRDTEEDPCTGNDRPHPVRIVDGQLSLPGCATTQDGHRAAFADAHDLTRLVVAVDGRPVPAAQAGPVVAGIDAVAPQSGEQFTDPAGLLPSVGGPPGVLMLVGLVFVMFGVVLLAKTAAANRPFHRRGEDARGVPR